MSELVRFLKRLDKFGKPVFAEITTRTIPDLKRSHPFGKKGLIKVARRTVLIGAGYATLVTNARIKEQGEEAKPFHPSSLWGGRGEHDPAFPNLLARHKATGDRYLMYKPDSVALEERYFFPDGKEIPAEEVQPFLKGDKPSYKQDLIDEVRWRVLDLRNLKAAKCFDEVFLFGGTV